MQLLTLQHVMANLIRKPVGLPNYQNRPRFVKDITRNILVCFSVHSSNCCSLAKRDC